MAPRPRDRAAGYVEYPGDLMRNPNYRRLSCAERGMFRQLRDALYEQPEVGVVEVDDRLLCSLALASIDEWSAARDAVGRMFDAVSRPGFWIDVDIVERHRANRRKYETKRDAGSKGGKSKAANAKASGATAQPKQTRSRRVAEPVADAVAEPNTNREQRTDSSLRSESSNGEPSAPLRSADGVAFSTPLRSVENAPERREPPDSAGGNLALADVAGEPEAVAAAARGVVLNLAGVLGLRPATTLLFPKAAVWEWLSQELRPTGRFDWMRLAAWLWDDGVRELELLKRLVSEVVAKGVKNPYAYLARDGAARSCRTAQANSEHAEAEQLERNAAVQRWLNGQ